MEQITRERMLYHPNSFDFISYTIDHVRGCSHGCKYPCCAFWKKHRYTPSDIRIKTYEEWCTPKIVSNTLELLSEEIPRLKDKIRFVYLCFSTDPFMYGYEEVQDLSLKAIQMLNKADIKCFVVTKGILPACLADTDVYLSKNRYGISLSSLDEDFRRLYEPNAAPIKDRIAALKALHDKGCDTFVKIEPYPTPNIIEQNLADILNAVSFVGEITFGRANFSREVLRYVDHKKFYNECAAQVIDFCDDHLIDYRITWGTITD